MEKDTNIITQSAEKIKKNSFSTQFAAPKDKIVSTVREIHPKFNGVIYDMCADPDYGVCIRADAARLIVSRFVAESDRKSDDHKWKKRISCRLPDDEYAAIRVAMRKAGFTTSQEFLRFLIRSYMEVN